MITQAVCVSYKEEILNGVHQPGDTYKIALFTNAATLDSTTTNYTTTNEVVGAGYTAGGETLAGFATATGGGKAWVTFTDVSWAAASFTARGALIYNASQGDAAVMVIDFGSDRTASGGTFLVDFPAAAAATALLRIN